ncbi:CYTH domain-containing protein [Alteromonas aestuariivivens]|uniref:CYTH domain-containing protein n=2 Tax=Alteromonas aestuariivivens TaxID=1938339 RepID=A0A3D8MDF7_9ALTE|nr:CYTH domain-containing protein [Alteromonas aestuariivivens]
MSEIELKFVTRQDPREAVLDCILPELGKQGMTVSQAGEKRLQNDYYDTLEHDFQLAKIGFRVRGCNQQFEQTLKTQGRVSGGLHQRLEFNIPLGTSEPDLSLFDSDVWPDGWDVSAMQRSLQRQFSTHFRRTTFDVTFDDAHVEMVVDVGEVSTDKLHSPIQEIELELKTGQVSDLFTVAFVINQLLDVRLSDVSKAAQGYQLLNGITPQVTPLPEFLPLTRQDSTESAFAKALECGLAHWQIHEHRFLQTGSVKMLSEVVTAVRLMLQTVSLYLPVLQCPAMLTLHKNLLAFAQAWQWHQDLHSLNYLLSKKSLFAKCLAKHPALTSYLQGRQAGLLQAHAPENRVFDSEATALKLEVSALLHNKPWQGEVQGYDMPVMEHAKGWLSQGWQTVQQSMPANRPMRVANYCATEVLLRQTLWNGFLLGDLFAEERGEFRAPWLDLLIGLDELNALLMLKQSLHESELESQEELNEWANEKIGSLLRVMERTREVATRGDVYW